MECGAVDEIKTGEWRPLWRTIYDNGYVPYGIELDGSPIYTMAAIAAHDELEAKASVDADGERRRKKKPAARRRAKPKLKPGESDSDERT